MGRSTASLSVVVAPLPTQPTPISPRHTEDFKDFALGVHTVVCCQVAEALCAGQRGTVAEWSPNLVGRLRLQQSEPRSSKVPKPLRSVIVCLDVLRPIYIVPYPQVTGSRGRPELTRSSRNAPKLVAHLSMKKAFCNAGKWCALSHRPGPGSAMLTPLAAPGPILTW